MTGRIQTRHDEAVISEGNIERFHLRLKYDKGVLGRSSSVAEREAAHHRFEGEAFYGSRSRAELHKKGGGQESSRNLDSWVSARKSEDFKQKLAMKTRSSSRTSSSGGEQQVGGSSVGRSMMDQKRIGTNNNAGTDRGISFLVVIIMLVIAVRCLL